MDPPWGDGYYRKVVNEAKERAMDERETKEAFDGIRSGLLGNDQDDSDRSGYWGEELCLLDVIEAEMKRLQAEVARLEKVVQQHIDGEWLCG